MFGSVFIFVLIKQPSISYSGQIGCLIVTRATQILVKRRKKKSKTYFLQNHDIVMKEAENQNGTVEALGGKFNCIIF